MKFRGYGQYNVHIYYKFSKNIIKCNNIFNNKDTISYRRNARFAADVTFATERVMVSAAFHCSERG